MIRAIIFGIIFLICADIAVVYVVASNGMKYPFAAAAILNMLVVVATNVVGIGWTFRR